jgi:hypothetical protein
MMKCNDDRPGSLRSTQYQDSWHHGNRQVDYGFITFLLVQGQNVITLPGGWAVFGNDSAHLIGIALRYFSQDELKSLVCKEYMSEDS